MTKRLTIQISIATGVAAIIIITSVSWLFFRVAAMNRDVQRLADMRAVQGALERLYQDEQTFVRAAETCAENAPVSDCNLQEYMPDIATLTDPGDFAYTVTVPPSAAAYAVRFTLEVGTKNLKKGNHILSEQGIK